MRSKQLFINLTSNIVAFSSSLLVSFVLTPYLIMHIGKEAYSFFPMSNNFVGYITVITLALNSMVARFITIELESDNVQEARKYFSSAFISNVIVVLVLILPLSLMIENINIFINIPKEIYLDVKILFALVFLSLFIDLLSSVFGVASFAVNRLDLRAYAEIVKGIIRVVLFVTLFAFFEPSIIFIGVVNLCLSIYSFIVQVVISKILLPSFKVVVNDFRFDYVIRLLKSGFWNVVNALGMSLLLGMSLFLTNYHIGTSAGGDLAIALMLPAFISGIISMIVSVLMPRLMKIYASLNKKELLKELIFSQRLLGICTTVPISIVIVFGDVFFKLWVPTEYSNTLPLLSTILLIPLLIHGNMWSIYSVNIVLDSVKIPSLVLILVGIISLALASLLPLLFVGNVFVIPTITTTMSIMYYLFFIPIYASRQMGVCKYKIYHNMIKSILFSLLFCWLLIEAKDMIKISTWLDLFLCSTISFLIGVSSHAIISFSDKIPLFFRLKNNYR